MFFFSSRRRHTRSKRDWSSDVCSSDLVARATREEYVGTWLPEPVATDDRHEPEGSLALTESVTLAFIVLLETLSPEERAVFLLREVFDYRSEERRVGKEWR